MEPQDILNPNNCTTMSFGNKRTIFWWYFPKLILSIAYDTCTSISKYLSSHKHRHVIGVVCIWLCKAWTNDHTFQMYVNVCSSWFNSKSKKKTALPKRYDVTHLLHTEWCWMTGLIHLMEKWMCSEGYWMMSLHHTARNPLSRTTGYLINSVSSSGKACMFFPSFSTESTLVQKLWTNVTQSGTHPQSHTQSAEGLHQWTLRVAYHPNGFPTPSLTHNKNHNHSSTYSNKANL